MVFLSSRYYSIKKKKKLVRYTNLDLLDILGVNNLLF